MSQEGSQEVDGAKSDADLLAEAKERYKLCSEAWEPNRKAWLEDAQFREPGKGNQWPATVKAEREADGRPCIEVDKLNQYVRQVVNDGRQNRPGVKVRPEGDGANADAAEGWEDFIRGICARSNADEAYDNALDHAVGNGYGFFRVVTDYSYPGTFNQELQVSRVPNPRDVMLDPYIQKADGSDACFGFVEVDIPKDEFKRKYPKAKFTNWDGDATRYGDGWLSDECVRVCEYFYKVETPELVHLLDDGTTISDEDYQAILAELTQGAPNPKIVESRELPTSEVKWCRMSGAEILEKKDWVGKQYIPLILVIGNESNINGRVSYWGLIRPAKDGQRLYNYARSAYVETVALAPKAPLQAAAQAVAGHPEWDDANVKNYSTLLWNHKDSEGDALPAPGRIQPPTVATGWAQDMQMSEHDIQGSMGMYNSSIGEKSNEKSGKAIMARQREGDTGTFHFQDNLNRAIRYLGRIIVDAAPRVYDTKRVIHLLGEDGQQSTAQLDPDQKAPAQLVAGQKIFNFGLGKYGVDISSGPSYTTKRQEALDAQMQLVQSAPETMQFAGDLIVRNMDWPGADDLAERYRLMLPPPIQQALQAKDQGVDPQVISIKQQAQQALQAKDQQIKAAEERIQQDNEALRQLQDKVRALQSQVVVKGAEVEVRDKQANTQAYDAETRRLSALAPAFALDPQSIAQVVQQAVADALATHLTNAHAPPPAPPQQTPPQGGFFTPS